MKLNDYEVLKETKVCYEYFNDILDNCGFKLNQSIVQDIKKSILTLEDLYSITYNRINQNEIEKKKLQTDLECPHCSNDVVISDLIDYAYLCNECDENYYLGESDLNCEWYFESDKPVKLTDSFLLEISYDKDEKQVYIGTESSSGTEYECKTNTELKNAIDSYIENYLIDEEISKNKYIIKIWETEVDRDLGESFEYLKDFNDKEEAILKAKKLMNNNDYASLEVVDSTSGNCCYFTDGNIEEYYSTGKPYNKICRVSKKEISKYIDAWSKHEELPNDNSLLYCNDGNVFVGIDNTSGECYVEEFKTEKEVLLWLNSDYSCEEIRNMEIE